MNCPRPRSTRTGELECPACGLTWGVDDDQSHECPKATLPEQYSPERRRITKVRTKEIGQRAIENIRNILRKGS